MIVSDRGASPDRRRTRWRMNDLSLRLLFVVLMLICMMWARETTARSGIDRGTGCRYEGATKGEFLAAETICLGWGSLGVKKAVADGNTLRVSVDNSLADTLG